MFHQSERSLIFIVKYAPLLIIIILSLTVIYFIDRSNSVYFEKEQTRTIKLYKDFNNKRIQEEVYRAYEYIKQENKNSRNKLKVYLKQRVYEAHAIATKIYEDNKGSKNKDEILQLIRSAIGSIIYNQGRGYFFINDITGMNRLQPLNKKIEDTNILHLKDVNGYAFMKTINQSIKDKTERYDTYYWYKNAKDKIAYEKVSFYKFFEPLNISIGTGEYMVDFEKELKQRVLKEIQNIKLSDGGYIFVFDYLGNLIAHKNPKAIGRNYLNKKTINKFHVIKESIKIAKSEKGEGFLSYLNPTFDKKPYRKTSFIKGYNEWEWFIGTGYDDKKLQKLIKEAKEEFKKKNQEELNELFLISLIITCALLLLSIFLSKHIERIFFKYRQKIQDEEKEFRNLFEYSNIGLAFSDNEGKFIKVNNKFSQMLGYDNRMNLQNKTWYEVTNDDFIEEENRSYFDLLNGKIETYSIEKIFIKSNGEQVDALLAAHAFKVDKKIKYILFSIIDISEIKTKDKVLFQQSKMAAMGEMISNIAHQWRQPLSLISTASSGMKMQKEHDLLTDSYMEESLTAITEATQYLSQTIDDFKNYFKPNENESEFNIKHLLNKTLSLTSSEFINKEIEVVQDVEDINIISFENDLIQILINILNNAKDALQEVPHKKIVMITTKVSKDHKRLVLSIKDSAGGVPDKIATKIFEPYFTTKHQSNGTGIGLYMVNEIVEKHMKGKIRVRNVDFTFNNENYHGAEFKIYIPIE